MLKYRGHSITFQEVPNEVSLCLNITNCQGRCDRCHSPDLRLDVGEPLLRDIDGMLRRYGSLITCVCFLGEGNDYPSL